MKLVLSIFVSVALLVVVAGCGDKEKLGGKVIYPDGKPLTKGTIYFSNPTFLARATIRSDGTYDVGSLGATDGLPPGEYKVFIVGAVESRTGPADKESLVPLVATEYTSKESTPLTVNVPGERVFNIVVEKPGD